MLWKGLLLWIYGCLGKLQWNIVTWKRRFLQSLKCGTYYWYRLYAPKKSEDFETKNLEDSPDLYLQSDILLLADVFDNFRNICLEIYKPDPAKFPSAPGLAWQVALKKTKIKLDL